MRLHPKLPGKIDYCQRGRARRRLLRVAQCNSSSFGASKKEFLPLVEFRVEAHAASGRIKINLQDQLGGREQWRSS
jgi:hypothetical protein